MADEKSQEKSVEGQDALGIAEDSTIIEHKALDQGASTAEPLLFIAADDASQENCVNGEDTLRSAQESTNAEHKTLEKALGTTIGSGNHTPPDVQAALHRLLQLLESGQKELTSTLQQVIAESAEDDQNGPEPEIEYTSSAPDCEIVRISNAEWRARQDHQRNQWRYSLLTVAPKERGDGGSKSQAVEMQPGPLPGPSNQPIETSAVAELGSKNIGEKPYRAILNGRAELMEVLGEIFDAQSVPAFYFWFWPFKYLIVHGEKLRARLSEEESKFGDTNQKPESEASPPMAGEADDVAQSGDSRSKQEQASDIPQVRVDHEEDLNAGHNNKERMSSQESEQAGQNVTELVDNTVDHEVEADSITADEETGEVRSEHDSQPTKPDTQTADDTRLRDELRCLVRFMDNDLEDLMSVQKDIDNETRKSIAFDHLWQLYKPGHVVVSRTGPKRAYVVLHVTGGRSLQRNSQFAMAEDDVSNSYDDWRKREKEAYRAKYPKTSPFVIDCFYLDFDGTKFGPLPQKFMLQEYEGEVAITSLEVFPIRFDDDPKNTEKLLLKRGRKFVKLASVDHKYYSGRTLGEDRFLELPGEVHGEIIVDFALAMNHFRESDQGEYKFGTGVIANPTPRDEREIKGYYNIANVDYRPTTFMEDDKYDNELRADFFEKTLLLKERSYHEKLSNEAMLLLPPRVYGFSLLDRRWFAFDISLVEDIKDSNQGFDHLVIPEDHKKIMQALVRHHTKGPGIATAETKIADQGFSMDVIRGKGKGLIILLHGVPGVGKTSTAECVAAQTRRPLFPITCGDIGSTAERVEAQLNTYFDMAHKWGCVLLLDEADVFLARREKGGDLQRNGIVSVFLRVLEYYSGILILTTNRIGEFDEAFSSRVHIKLYYPRLDRRSTLEIWKMNVRRVAESEELGVDVNEADIKRFARRQWADSAENPTQRWNGRQIRNAFQAAIALAKWDHQEGEKDPLMKPCLLVKHFEIVAQTSAHFDAYITKMHGIDEGDTWETIAARDFLRKNETPRRPTSRFVQASARAQTGRRFSTKAESLDDEEESDETDSDDQEEKMKKLEDELNRMKQKQKKRGSPNKKLKDPGRESSRKPIDPEVKAGGSSDSSGEDQA